MRDEGSSLAVIGYVLLGRDHLFAQTHLGADHRPRQRADLHQARPPAELDGAGADRGRPRPDGHGGGRPQERPSRADLLRFPDGAGGGDPDIVVDAWRIESASDNDELGLLSSAYQFGYRVALLATDAIILAVAEHTSWPLLLCAVRRPDGGRSGRDLPRKRAGARPTR
ncbi:MAG: hypothetical protein WDM81_00085 [Rhizomicrobium sp.]